MRDTHWHERGGRSLAILLSGNGGERRASDRLLVVFNASSVEQPFRLPDGSTAGWRLLVDTATTATSGQTIAAGGSLVLAAHSLQVLAGVEPGPQAAVAP